MSKSEVIELLLQKEETNHVVLTLVTSEKISVEKLSYDFVGEGLIFIETPYVNVIDENSIVSIKPLAEVDHDIFDQLL